MKRVFKVGETINVSNGVETIPVTVSRVFKNTVTVEGPRSAPTVVCPSGMPSIIGHLKYYKNISNYSVSRGGTNSQYKKLDRYIVTL